MWALTALLLFALLAARAKAVPLGEEAQEPSTGPGPPPADMPSLPGGYKRLSGPVTAELAGKASAVLNSGAPVGTMQPFVASDGLTYGAWVTYHPKPHGWVRAVEIWEAV